MKKNKTKNIVDNKIIVQDEIMEVNNCDDNNGEHKNNETNKQNPCEIEPANHDELCELLEYVLDITSGKNEMNNSTDSRDTQTVTDNFNDKGVQVNAGDFGLTFSSFIKSKSDLITLCNIKSLSILEEITKIMDETFP